MDIQPENPWQGTPDISARIVVAIARVASVLRAGVWEAATAEHLNPAQAEILQLLRDRTQGVRLSWLAAQLSVSAASASDSVTALVAKGLVRKARAEDDGRASALWLTEEGKALAARMAGAVSFADEAAARLPGEDQAALLIGLFKLIAQLQKSERFPALRACLSCRYFEANAFPGSAAPHHCALVKAPLPITFLRIDCAEHVPADPVTERRNWDAFA
ncbi:MarR family winged helix-turn-helix transcriptional regulator [Pseudoduganella chitinolytica]|uniref:MarR family winged helix-turn-helix transcriptional regulator n=1 Tax=Pseudoduganella chitinolytica TaxID=34070 RepID=A0ABY8BA83_9BURK|nr:MarR family winged helix-turn-helix transcriptional regulator [Pseudoduganella chitinolytica]WEF32834.1 MarR family winged helix-turn-helix transcriptional regulator [Pseudoduganella chitinolytica]